MNLHIRMYQAVNKIDGKSVLLKVVNEVEVTSRYYVVPLKITEENCWEVWNERNGI